MIRLTPKESRYFHPLNFFSSQGMKKILVEFLIPGLLVSRDQKMIFWSLGWQILSFEIVWVFVWIFLGRHIDMSYYYSSVFLFLKNFLVFFFLFFLLHYFLNRSDLNNGAEAYSRPSWLFLSKVLTLFFQAEFTLVTPRLGMNAKMEGRFLAKWASWTPQCGHETICE